MATATIEVYIKLPSGKAISTEHLPSETVSKVAEVVAKGEGVPESRVRIKYQGKTLDKTKTIGYLGICAETILKGEVIFPKDLTIYVKYPCGQCEPLLVQTTDTVNFLKKKINEVEDIPLTQQVLKKESNGATITGGDALLADVGLTNECVIEVKKNYSPKTTAHDDNATIEEDEIDEDKKEGLISSFDTQGRRVEVVFCFDTSGSMYSCIAQVRQKLRSSCERLLRDIPGIRIGVMAHGDYRDYMNYVIRYVDLTSDVDTVVSFVTEVPGTNGGDAPECYEWALRKAQQLDWSEDSAKALVMIGDELPHMPSYTDQNLFWMDEADVLAGMGVKIYAVQALETAHATPFYEEIAERTSGYYLELKNFSLITDMFLAVCYREADPRQLDDFVEEVEKEGRMTEDTKAMLENLEDKPKPREQRKAAKKAKRYVKQPWWDPSLESSNARPEYLYDQEKDSWKPNNRTTASSTTYTPPSVSYTSYSPTKRRSKLRKMFCFA